jgi:hypothetical protein
VFTSLPLFTLSRVFVPFVSQSFVLLILLVGVCVQTTASLVFRVLVVRVIRV